MSRFVLTPRAALVLVGIVLVLALGVVLAGSWTGDGGGASADGVTVVSGAPTVAGGGEPSRRSLSPPATGGSSPVAGLSGAPSGSPSRAPAVAVVYVVGAVGRAGVVTVPPDARVSDALTAAGGASADADLSRLNLARPVVDGERLYVPRAGETEIPAEIPAGGGGGAGVGPGGSGAAPGDGGAGVAGAGGAPAVVDLNVADATALETLPGIGPALAERILAWREEHGGFRSVEDLLEVSGIGEGRFAELQDRVRV
ncbi:helix-hairpin-helix domain-containing protein [Curtobacterium sp. MCBD17_021]|uniref:helix-hairpin-helix domain-containing protein n=1 Tax=Curtobacterium sp. MCBD17_021 TaxID=2175665 RepID=UPI000DA743A0|nr:helix-hairpin-helix domain-containing protein [Curtobacterium sp. MCBD17_021]PZE68920.1 ComEA family DNA-binding protein [Curtobacterium sp. MCBD17_021]